MGRFVNSLLAMGVCAAMSVTSAMAQAPLAPPSTQTAHPSATRPVVADASTPQGTLVLLARAGQSGDAGSARELFHATTPQEEKIADVFVERANIDAKFRQAVAKAMGEDAATALTGVGPDDAKIAEQRISQANVKIEGDKAAITINDPQAGPPGQAPEPVNLVRVNNKWKVPIGTVTAGVAQAELDERLKTLKMMSDVVAQVTTEVDAGKFKTFAEVDEALRSRLMEVALKAEGMNPATQPGGQPTTAPAPAPGQ